MSKRRGKRQEREEASRSAESRHAYDALARYIRGQIEAQEEPVRSAYLSWWTHGGKTLHLDVGCAMCSVPLGPKVDQTLALRPFFPDLSADGAVVDPIVLFFLCDLHRGAPKEDMLPAVEAAIRGAKASGQLK